MIYAVTFAAIAISALLALIVRRQYFASRSEHARRLRLVEEIAYLRRTICEVGKVVAISGGGLDKRISEHDEIVSAIRTRAPALLREEPGLQYWLAANSEFFVALKAAVPYQRD